MITAGPESKPAGQAQAPPAPSAVERLYPLRVGTLLSALRREHFSFQMICAYLFVEYVRPQSIIPALDVLPWGKVFVLLSLVGLLARGGGFVRNAANLWMVLLFGVILASSVTATNREYAIASLPDFYTWLIVYFLIINLVRTRVQLFIFLLIFLVASFKISASLSLRWAARGFTFADWGLKGPPGFFENSGELAIQMAVFWPIAHTFFRALRHRVGRVVRAGLLAMPVTAVVTILGSSSRGGQLAMLAQFGFGHWRQLLRLQIIAAGAIVLVLGLALMPEKQKERFREIGEDKTSIQRLLYWKHGKDMMLSHPLLGVGYANFPLYYQRHFPEDILFAHAQVPHNIFVQVGSELGFSGLICYVALIYLGFANAYAARKAAAKSGDGPDELFRNLPDAMNASFIGFLVAGQFVSVVYYPFMWVHLAFVVCLRNICEQK